MNNEERIQKLAAFTRNSPNPLLEFSSDGALAYYNEAARHLALLLGHEDVAAILPPDNTGLALECLLTGESRTNLQTTMQQRTLSWSFIPIAETHTVQCYVNDITERLNLEAQLRHSVKMDAVGQLAAGVAHDFNNILTIIQGHADLMLQSQTVEGANEKSVKQISSAAQRAGKLIKQLLMFSRKQVMQPRHVNLNEIVTNLSPMLQGLLGEKVAFQFFPGPNLPALYVDVGMIEQVLLNLVINSRDAMPEGGRLTLSTSHQTLDPVAVVLNPEARPGSFVCLTVTDTGCGMDARTMSHLFEPFFTTKEVGKGTGLGLASVYGILKQHDGWVVVESQVGVGSTFTLFLPDAGRGPAGTSRAPGQVDTQTTTKQNMATGTETILVAEDEPVLRELVVNILEFCGYRIYQAESGPAAVKVWEEHRGEINLLLTDMVMPGGMSGRQLAERLQKSDPALKVIYTSGYSPGMAGKDIALLEGFNFLAKPYPPSKLAQVVRESLDGAPPKTPPKP
jgi:two-component system, cell cycle sensor histidine kinase and response regulator CckA